MTLGKCVTDEMEWLYFQDWQVNVFVHENHATDNGGDGTHGGTLYLQP